MRWVDGLRSALLMCVLVAGTANNNATGEERAGLQRCETSLQHVMENILRDAEQSRPRHTGRRVVDRPSEGSLLRTVVSPHDACRRYEPVQVLPHRHELAVHAARSAAVRHWECVEKHGRLVHLQKRAMEAHNYRATYSPAALLSAYSDPRYTWELFEPLANCPYTTRVGTVGDGGKWLCNLDEILGHHTRRPCVVYSFGSAGDSSFEAALVLEYGCIVHTFDPTPGTKVTSDFATWPGNMCFYPAGLGPVPGGGTVTSGELSLTLRLGGVEVAIFSLLDVVRALNDSQIDILKVDIEGSEWGALPWALEQPEFSNLGIAIITVEMHLGVYGAGAGVPEVQEMFAAMALRGYFPFSREANLRCGPICMEYSFVHISHI